MAKLTDLAINIITDQENIHIKTPVNVTKEGLFTTTLPAESVRVLEEYGADLKPNRLGNPGYFESKTLDGLRAEVTKLVEDAVSRELVEDKLVIKYEILTDCNYVKDTDGEIIPNGSWCKNHDDFNVTAFWQTGSKKRTSEACTPSTSIFAIVLHKKRYAYKSGRQVVTYEKPADREGGFKRTESAIDWLMGLVNTRPTSLYYCGASTLAERCKHLPEVDATEENARFFVSMLKLIYKMNELFKGFSEPENILAFIAQNKTKEIESL